MDLGKYNKKALKITCFTKIEGYQFPIKYWGGGGHFPKCIFAEGSFNQKPVALGEIRGAIWRYFVMKLPPKNVKNHDKLRFHYSVRQKIAAPGPIKLRTIFPHTSVLPKPPQLPYGGKENRRDPIDSLLTP